MRKRLIALIDRADEECKHTKDCKICSGYNKGSQCMNYHIADYLIANGVVVMPCKVGDKMYYDGERFASHCKGKIMEATVAFINTEVCSTFRGEVDMVFDFDNFGKTVFLNREDAERALKGR